MGELWPNRTMEASPRTGVLTQYASTNINIPRPNPKWCGMAFPFCDLTLIVAHGLAWATEVIADSPQTGKGIESITGDGMGAFLPIDALLQFIRP